MYPRPPPHFRQDNEGYVEDYNHYMSFLEKRDEKYMSRQNTERGTPVRTNVFVKYPKILPKKQKKMIQTPRILPEMLKKEWRNKGNTLAPCKIKTLNRDRQIPNVEQFYKVFANLEKAIKMQKAPKWIQNSIAIPLGPEELQKITEKQVKESKARQSGCFTVNPRSSSFLFTKSLPGEIETIKKYIFGGRSSSEHDVLEISEHDGGHSVLIRYGESPRFVCEASQSTRLVVFETGRDFGGEAPDDYYRKLIPVRIRSMRPMSSLEKKSLIAKYGRWYELSQKLRILEFSTPEDREKAIPHLERVRNEELRMERALKHVKLGEWQRQTIRDVDPGEDFRVGEAAKLKPVGAVMDLHFCDTMFDSLKDSYESVRLKVCYDMGPKFMNGVRVVLKYESDKHFAEHCLNTHQLNVSYYDHNNFCDMKVKYYRSCNSFVVDGFPKFLRSFESRAWLVSRILALNNIEFSALTYHWMKSKRAVDTANEAYNQQAQRRIDYEMYRHFHESGLYRPSEDNWEDCQGRGCRNLLKHVNDRPDVPWFVVKKKTDPTVQKFEVFYKNTEHGIRVIQRVLTEACSMAVLRIDLSDTIGPELTPLFRKMCSISRVVRVAYKKTIEEFSDLKRHFFYQLALDEDESMECQEAMFYSMRFIEKWKRDEEIGEIGMEGWDVNHVRDSFDELRDLLDPLEFDATSQEELLHGVGEIYVRSLETKYKGGVVVDIDKFSGVISIYGDSKKLAFQRLHVYSRSKARISLENIEIPVYFPFMNDAARSFLSTPLLDRIGASLDSSLALNDKTLCISFNGTIEAYEVLMKGLEALSTAVFRNFVSERHQPLHLECPVCLCETGIKADFYRLNCGHSMCRECVNHMIKAELDKFQFKMACPMPDCEKLLTPTEIKHIILGDERRLTHLDTQKTKKLARRARQAILNSNHEMKACLTPDCVGICFKSDGDVKVPKKCSSCHRVYCRSCLSGTHPNQTCEEFQRLLDPDESIAAYVKDLGTNAIRECPSCHNLIEKTAGCNHIQCACKYHFCWVCGFGSELTRQVYEHMTNAHGGPGGDLWLIEGNAVLNIRGDMFPAEDPGEGAPFRFIRYLPVGHYDEDVRAAVLQHFNTSRDHNEFAERFRSIYNIALPAAVRR